MEPAPGREGSPPGADGAPGVEGIPPEGMPPGMEGIPPGVEGIPPDDEGDGIDGIPPGVDGDGMLGIEEGEDGVGGLGKPPAGDDGGKPPELGGIGMDCEELCCCISHAASPAARPQASRNRVREAEPMMKSCISLSSPVCALRSCFPCYTNSA